MRCSPTTASPAAPGVNVPVLLGPPAEIAAAIRPYRDLGFGTVIVRLPAPFDAETIARIGEVRDALDAIPSVDAVVAGTRGASAG